MTKARTVTAEKLRIGMKFADGSAKYEVVKISKHANADKLAINATRTSLRSAPELLIVSKSEKFTLI